MTCVCDRFYYSIFYNVFKGNIITSKQERRFEKMKF